MPSSYRRERLLGLRRPFSRDHPHCTAGSDNFESSTRKLACSRGALATVQPGYSRSPNRDPSPIRNVLLRFGVCPARAGTLTLGRKGLLRLRARLAMGRQSHRILPRPSFWAIDVSQPHPPGGVRCPEHLLRRVEQSHAHIPSACHSTPKS